MSELLSTIASPADLHKLSDAQLLELAQEMRNELIRVLSIRPAHFASNLGVIELCLALHLTFDFTKDRLIWDTGHQIYPHKLITGRNEQFESIRTKGGLMGYPNPHESPFDLFMTGHAGCSVSCTLGLRTADELLGESERHSVAVIGDGALPSGIVFEALNNAGHLKRKLLVILNDNKMSICPRVGAPQASEDPVTFHTPPVFEKVGPDRSILSLKRGGSKGYTDAASSAIQQAMENDPKVTVMTAAMCQGNKLEKVRDAFPDRFFDVGICESHAVAFAAGQAKAGVRPIVAIYSTFLQRAFDQIFQEVALQNLPVTFCLDRAGLTGPDGPTHHGAFDTVYLRLSPNMVVMAPGDELDLAPMLQFALEQPGPAALRYPKATLEKVERTL